MSDIEVVPPAGWYPDPGGAGQRYWDGAAWSAHLRPRSAPSVPTPTTGAVWEGSSPTTSVGELRHAPLADIVPRAGAHVLDALLTVVTLGVGWLVWFLVVGGRGLTPGKQLLRLCCVDVRTGQPLGLGGMVVRELIGKSLIGFVALATFGLGLPLLLWPLWDERRQQLWDKMADSVVVDVPST